MKKIKKIIALMLTVFMMASLAACGGGNEATGDATDGGNSGDKKVVNIGAAIYQYDDNFMTLYRTEMEKYVASLNESSTDVEYKLTLVDGKNDMATQTEQINSFITQGMDAIILNPVQTSSAKVLVDKCTEANIPVVIINREPDASIITGSDKVCYVGADAKQSGTYQGEIIRDLPNHGDADGDGVVRYIMIQGDPENSDAQFRTEYSVKALTDAGIEVEELMNQIGNWATDQGQQIAANGLAQFGNKVDVIFCNNDGMAVGASAAIKQAGRTVGKDIYLVGVDAIDQAMDLLSKGDLTGTVRNNHIDQSHTAVDVAIKAVNGEKIDDYYWIDYEKVTEGAAAATDAATEAEATTEAAA